MNETHRMLKVLSVLVRAGRPLTVREIRKALPASMRVHVRSLQRDLVALRRPARLRLDAREKPYRWSVSVCPCCGGAA